MEEPGKWYIFKKTQTLQKHRAAISVTKVLRFVDKDTTIQLRSMLDKGPREIKDRV